MLKLPLKTCGCLLTDQMSLLLYGIVYVLITTLCTVRETDHENPCFRFCLCLFLHEESKTLRVTYLFDFLLPRRHMF